MGMAKKRVLGRAYHNSVRGGWGRIVPPPGHSSALSVKSAMSRMGGSDERGDEQPPTGGPVLYAIAVEISARRRARAT